ncbi:MAG: hypothetical protein AAGE98_21160, partial [Actinomycetota bacterium]
MTIGLILTAFGLGLRHGIDWDHIAAISDLTGSSESRKHGWWLSMWYAVGHGIAVFVLGVGVIALSATIPEGLDTWMGRVVGLTLIVLGVWLIVDLFRRGDDFRLRSRWMIVLDGTFRGLRRVRSLGGRREIEVDHDHDHEHVEGTGHDEVVAHDHAHVDADVRIPADVTAGRGRPLAHGHSHGHRHRHRLTLPDSVGAGSGAAAGIGVLHGVGIESPTQIAIFVATTAAVGTGAGT